MVLDLDGTLLRSDKTVSDASTALLEQLRSQGAILINCYGSSAPGRLTAATRDLAG
jgi:hydroxymethylpyrimidine pyrophosphatase-like HAD family hydrolase